MEMREFLKRYNALGAHLAAHLSAHPGAEGTGNAVFSPLSVLALLGMVMEAAGNGTRAEILGALGFGENYRELRQALKELRGRLTRDGALSSANAAAVRRDLRESVRPDWLSRLRGAYAGELFAAEDTAAAVNEWVGRKTRGMITDLADRSVGEMPACFLNALAFDGKWDEPYLKEDVEEGGFRNADGTVSTVPMLRSTEWTCVGDERFTGFAKPYRGGAYELMALLPRDEACADPLPLLRETDLTALYEERKTGGVAAVMPEFGAALSADLKEACMALGIRRAFSPEADFSSMTDRPLTIGALRHRAVIGVSRKGTKAAAATMAGLVTGFLPESEREVVLDRPFLFAVMHGETGLPVFEGAVRGL